jgi:hypothetical protein
METTAKDMVRQALMQEELVIGPVSMLGEVRIPLPGISVTWHLHVFNESGGLLRSVVPTAGVAALDLSSLPAGNYELLAMSAFGASFSGTIITY